MIASLLILSNQIKNQKLPVYKRFLYKNIDFNNRLLGIIGARGAGKTTLLLQYLKEETRAEETLYIIADHPIVLEHGLFNIADEFQRVGGKLLIIDEIHKVKDFEIALKLIYDTFNELTVFFTGSSAVALNNAKADLSRRAILYRLPVLSFREYLELESDQVFSSYSLAQLTQDHVTIASDILENIKPFMYFSSYLQQGAYPFYKENQSTYLEKLFTASMQVLENDIPAIYSIDHDKINALKKMMVMLCQSEPFDINISKLCGAVGLNQRTLYKYLGILQETSLIRIMGAKSNGVSIISKPEKLYLANTNLFSIFCEQPKTGTIRETFFASMLAQQYTLSYPKSGDFLVNEKYTFEVGGRNKNTLQIKDINNAYIAADDLEIGALNKIPLWLFGFLY